MRKPQRRFCLSAVFLVSSPFLSQWHLLAGGFRFIPLWRSFSKIRKFSPHHATSLGLGGKSGVDQTRSYIIAEFYAEAICFVASSTFWETERGENCCENFSCFVALFLWRDVISFKWCFVSFMIGTDKWKQVKLLFAFKRFCLSCFNCWFVF